MDPLWSPSPERQSNSLLWRFAESVGRGGASYRELHHWSVTEPAAFWRAVWDFCGVIGSPGETVVENFNQMPGACWFPQARLNFAENLLEREGGDGLVFWGEEQVRQSVSREELRREAARVAAALRAQGVQAGDRVAAWLPNLPETIAVMLGAASIGAVFSSCSPDFGVEGVVDRFGQIGPKFLFATDGYFYDGKQFDCFERLDSIRRRIPSIEKVVVVRYAEEGDWPDETVEWEDWLAPFDCAAPDYAPLPFAHPLYILYSSGTTGVPKCLVHSAGGTLLQHLKEHQLHADLQPGDRLFYFTTCGWMMWNWLATGLASGATLCLYDGSPFRLQGRILLEYAAQERFTHFGTSAKYLDALAKSGLQPGALYDLPALRTVLSTGSPLSPSGFDFVYQHWKADVQLASISGGTDIVSCFVLGNPLEPVYRGEIQAPGMGMAVAVFDEAGQPLASGKGDLVCTQPFPSLPLGFWNDPGGERFRAAYFETFPGVWHHGDYAEWTPNGGMIIHGRSDATLNPAGVRIGTAEIYRQVEKLPEVLESIVIGQEWGADVRVVLFVRLRDGVELDEPLRDRIRQTIRQNTTPRHVPARILSVNAVPRTKSNKIVELAVRDIVHGREVKNREALANPEALEEYKDRPELAG